MGHASDIKSENVGAAQGEIEALNAVGATVVETPWDIPDKVKQFL